MKLIIRNGIIYDEDGIPQGSINEDYNLNRAIEAGSEAVEAIKKFVDQVNHGSFKPRTVVKEFESLLRKYDIEYEQSY